MTLLGAILFVLCSGTFVFAESPATPSSKKSRSSSVVLKSAVEDLERSQRNPERIAEVYKESVRQIQIGVCGYRDLNDCFALVESECLKLAPKIHTKCSHIKLKATDPKTASLWGGAYGKCFADQLYVHQKSKLETRPPHCFGKPLAKVRK